MPWSVYGIFIIFGLFVLLMIVNPRLSCFGKRISSPLYPLFRKKKQKVIKTEDYGFHLVDKDEKQVRTTFQPKDRSVPPGEGADKRIKKAVKTHDYGFHLVEKEEKTASGTPNRETETEDR